MGRNFGLWSSGYDTVKPQHCHNSEDQSKHASHDAAVIHELTQPPDWHSFILLSQRMIINLRSCVVSDVALISGTLNS